METSVVMQVRKFIRCLSRYGVCRMLTRRNEAGNGTDVGYICVGVADSACFLIDPQPDVLTILP